MMKLEKFLEFKRNGEIPDDIHPLLQALLLEASGDWKSAHKIAQNEPNPEGSWVHAYLHRVEGDPGNAEYWYRDAGRKMPDMSPAEEWEYIALALLRIR